MAKGWKFSDRKEGEDTEMRIFFKVILGESDNDYCTVDGIGFILALGALPGDGQRGEGGRKKSPHLPRMCFVAFISLGQL